MLTHKRINFVTPTFPHVYESLRLISPRGTPFTSLEKIVLPFTNSLWLFIFLALLISILTIYFVMLTINPCRFRYGAAGHFTVYAFDFINLLFGGSLTRMSRFQSARMVLGAWLLATLILRNTYFGAMFNFLQTKMHHSPVNTISKIMELNYTLYLGTGIYDVMYWSFPNLRNQLSTAETFVCTAINLLK